MARRKPGERADEPEKKQEIRGIGQQSLRITRQVSWAFDLNNDSGAEAFLAMPLIVKGDFLLVL